MIYIRQVCPYTKYTSLAIRIEKFVHTLIRDITKKTK